MSYTYSSVGTDRSFRILRIWGALRDAFTIHCDMIERSLDVVEPTYEALSYCWGGQSLTQIVCCNDLRLLVTKNCESAIRHLRPASTSESRLIWIDAVCIDQANLEERSHQVQLMGEIYKGASRVLVWLDNENSAVGPVSMPDPDDEQHVHSFAWLVRLGEATASQSLQEKGTELSRVAEELNDGVEVSAASIKQLLVRLPWFKRLWTVQEVVLGREATLLYGDRKVSLNALLEAKQVLSGLQTRGHHSIQAAASVLWNLFAVHLFGRRLLASAGAGQKSLIDPVCSFIGEVRYSKATNASDKVFGLYGLLRESGLPLPSPDYNKSTAVIYRETMISLMKATGSLKLLDQVDGLGSLPDRTSWVPDWSSSKHCLGPAVGPCFAVVDSQPVFRFLDDSMKLALKGFKIDRVTKRSPLSYAHATERLGEPKHYAQWTRNPPIKDRGWAQELENQPEHSNAILFLWNIRVLRDFVTTALDRPPGVASKQSVLALYHTLLSQRGGYDSEDLGLFDPDVGERRARDFFGTLCGKHNEERHPETCSAWIFGHDYALRNLGKPALRALANSQEYAVLRRISRVPIRRLIFDAMKRIRCMTVFKTEQGRIGIASWAIESGDELALCCGFGSPVLMRPVGGNFKFVASAYLHEVMYGEAWTSDPDHDLRELVFV